MLILDLCRHINTPTETSLSVNSQDKLAEAAFELIYCTINGRYCRFGDNNIVQLLKGDNSIDELINDIMELKSINQLPIAGQRLISGVLCLRDALQIEMNSATQNNYSRIKQLCKATRSAISTLVQTTNANPMIGEYSFMMEYYLHIFNDYGLIPTASLTPALVQHVKYQYLVNRNELIYVNIYDNMKLAIMPSELFRYAFTKGSKETGLVGVDNWIERTYEVLNVADSISASARSMNELARVMNASLAAYLLYDVGRTSLGWILDRFKENGKDAPKDLYLEQQISEENRAWIGEMLEFAGERFISTPVTQLLIQLGMTGQQPTVSIVRELLNNGMSVFSVYPDLLRNAWEEIIVDVLRTLPDELIEMYDSLYRGLEKGMRQQFVYTFQDYRFAKIALKLQDRWWRSKISFK